MGGTVARSFALLRAGEFLENKEKLLKRRDFSWRNGKKGARLTLHNTKSMLWREDVFAYVFDNDSAISPTAGMEAYLDNFPEALEQKEDDPLFVFSSGKRLDRKRFVEWIQWLLSALGLDGKKFNGISARKGGAQSLRMAGAPADVIRKMGRWAESSFVFETYQMVAPSELASYAQSIAALTQKDVEAKGLGRLLNGEFDSTGIFVEEEVEAFVSEIETKKEEWLVTEGEDLKLSLKKI